MKKILLLLAISVSQLAVSQTIRRVNNTGIPTAAASPNTVPVYTTAQAAHDAATAGDIIMLEPSATTYGNLTVTKKLTILGNGYFLGPASANGNPGLQANVLSAQLDYLYFNAGSEQSNISGIATVYPWTISTTDIVITRNFVGNVIYVSAANARVEQNFVNIISNSANNCSIKNNIIQQGINSTGNNAVFENNVLVQSYSGVNISNALSIKSNIDLANTSATFTGSSNITHNISVNGIFPSGNGNIQAAANIIIEDAPNTSLSFSEDSRFKLKASSPAIGAGFGGVDMGAFGGPFPYILSGIPAIPTIYSLAVPSTVTSNSMSITISTKNNN